MTKLAFVLALAATTTAVASTADAQGKGRNTDGVPPGQRPPAGMCRVWIDGVPAGRQAAPTDCATAEANRPANGRVIYGDDNDKKGKAKGKAKKAKGGNDDRDDRRDDDRRADRRDDDRRDRDGRDGRGNVCVDRDRDGVCDVRVPSGGTTGGYPTTLPQMLRTPQLRDGVRTAETLRWLRTSSSAGLQSRHVDVDNDDWPETITWMDAAGRILQVWTDRDRDGFANMVQVYENGRVVRTIGS